LLNNEPKGHRRDLLYNQIQLWMTQAESTKALLCVADFKDAIVPDNTGKYCCENSWLYEIYRIKKAPPPSHLLSSSKMPITVVSVVSFERRNNDAYYQN
jgi:hypothetical protein